LIGRIGQRMVIIEPRFVARPIASGRRVLSDR
jgi:hypothetical protein